MLTNLKTTVESLNFKFVNPEDDFNTNFPHKLNKYLFYLNTIIKYQEVRHFTFFQNTISKFKESEFINFSKKMSSIEGMSTLANAWIINQICSELKENECYVNIGCWKGFSLIAGMINTKCSVFGVDNFAWKEFGKKDFYKNYLKYKNSERHYFYEGDYIKFLKDWENKKKFIDFYFYDGPHTYNDQFQSLEIAANYFRSGSIILVDDTNWDEPREATMEFISVNSGKYKILYDLKCKKARHPTFWNGLMIFQKI